VSAPRIAWLAALALAAACLAGAAPADRGAAGPFAGAAPADSLIREGETHFARLWQLTFGGQNAEGYWSNDGKSLIFQATREGWPCDQQYLMDFRDGRTRRVSPGRGRTTCGYFLPGDKRVLFSSTHLVSDSCPPEPDHSQGYVWRVDPGYDIFTARPDGSDLRPLTRAPGYDAEATVSPDGRRIVFTSVRDGDLELYTMRADGGDVRRVTRTTGYDGGAFFSPDNQWLCYRANHPTDSAAVADYRALLARHLVRPGRMDLWVCRADGSEARRVTELPGASFAPYFTPDGRRLVFASNWENPRGRNFDLFLVGTDGAGLERVTTEPSFDAFPMFSPDGRYLVFASNRGGRVPGETNLFVAEWR
jgi:Tol biopolymer transport system component